MALISLRQLLDHAAENDYGVPAFNANNMEQVHAVMQAADVTNSPVIIQGSAGARKYAGSSFFLEIAIMISSFRPMGRVSDSMSV